MLTHNKVEITVKKADLLKALLENQATHIQEFNEAFEGWKVHVLAKLNESIVEFGETPDEDLDTFYLSIPKPKSHEKEYQEIIEMVSLDVNDTFTVDQVMFRRYMRDEWDWSENFKRISAMYKAG